MMQTLNPIIIVTVFGSVGSGKSYILTWIEEVVKRESGGSAITDAADVDDEWRMNGDDLTTWQKLQGGAVIRLKEYTGQGLSSYGEERICRASELLDVTYPTGRQLWILPDTLHATIAALTTVYDQELLIKGLRKLTSQPTECFSVPKYGKQGYIPVDTLPVNQPPRFLDEYILTPESRAKHGEIKAALPRKIKKIAEIQLEGRLDRATARGE